ncbi:DC1 [Arabidopsis thaliana x Arabidopsis arenosa]|uniref:DC1 n=1 Tax=Arabidopsis thaliana x Arabidopsis arenosa TaxID=1240361 RepID=A0A8T2AA90_9BRAS|nr:DC1 [Arabidopsis thaliana x Arabidopsis arenosa]
MGRPKPEDSIRHFSHPHPLFHSSLNPPDQFSSSFYCLVCKLKLLNLPSYSCKPCNFHIHRKCSELPQKIRHPFDKNHLLSLIPSPKYQEGRFRCDACGKDGDGFAYHCGDCGIDLHTVCANMPSRVTHQSHPHHQLSLTFSMPSGGPGSAAASSFSCCVCRGLGSNSWLYSCRECGGFDAHLLCARRKFATPTNLVQHVHQNRMQPQFIGTTPFVNVPSPVINNPYPLVLPTITSPMIRPMINEMINNLVTNTPQNPSQVSQLHELLGPLGMGSGGPVDGSGSSSSSGFLGFDPSVFSSVDPSVFAGFDPSLLSTLFSGLDFFS